MDNIDTNEEICCMFSPDLDEDYCRMTNRVTQKRFSRVYLAWIQHCISQRDTDDVVGCLYRMISQSVKS